MPESSPLSFPISTSSYQPSLHQSNAPARNPALEFESASAQAAASNLTSDLDYALRYAPSEQRAELEDLCHWLVCCKNLWQTDMQTPDTAEPFSLHARRQSPHADPDCIENTVYAILGEPDADLLEDINRYVFNSNDSHWYALREREYPAALIDPTDEPRNWPQECLAWAIRTMDMRGADLFFANLAQLHLPNVDFGRADLQYACADGANIPDANLGYAKVEDATFRATNLTGANLSGLTISTDKNNLERAILDNARLADIALDIDVYEMNAEGAFILHKDLLPPPLDLFIRRNLQRTIKQEHNGLAVKYLHRILPNIDMTPALYREFLELTPPEDRLAVLQTMMRHASAQYKAKMKAGAAISNNNTDIKDKSDIKGKFSEDAGKTSPAVAATSIEEEFFEGNGILYEATTYIAHQFYECIDKEDHDRLQNALGDICRKNLVYLDGIASRDPSRRYWRDSTNACLQLAGNETREFLKDIVPALLKIAKTTTPGFDSIRQALKHLERSNPAQAFRSLMYDLTPQQCHALIQRELDYTAEVSGSKTAAEPAPATNTSNATNATSEHAADAALNLEENPRELIDLIYENLPKDMQGQIHTLLQDKAEHAQEMHEGDCDYLKSYTASDEDGSDASISAITREAHADQLSAASNKKQSAPHWQTAFLASFLLPVSHFLQE